MSQLTGSTLNSRQMEGFPELLWDDFTGYNSDLINLLLINSLFISCRASASLCYYTIASVCLTLPGYRLNSVPPRVRFFSSRTGSHIERPSPRHGPSDTTHPTLFTGVMSNIVNSFYNYWGKNHANTMEASQ